MTITLNDTKNEPRQNDLKDINKEFHRLYGERKLFFEQSIKAGKLKLFVRLDSRLIVINGDEISEHEVNGETYHSYKAIIHSALATYYLLCDKADDPHSLLKSWQTSLEEFKKLPEAQEVSTLISELATSTQQDKTISARHLDAFAQKLETVFAKIMFNSALDEIERLTEILDEQYKRLNVASTDLFLIVFGGHQPRYKELASLVFTRWFDELSDHIVDSEHHVQYLEGGQSIDDAIELISTISADRELAHKFLGSVRGLNQDALGIVAEKAITKHWQNREASFGTHLE